MTSGGAGGDSSIKVELGFLGAAFAALAGVLTVALLRGPGGSVRRAPYSQNVCSTHGLRRLLPSSLGSRS
jgi:hypothetical protein